MTTQIFLSGLLAVSILTSLFTEAIKKSFESAGQKPCSNLIAGIVAVILAIAISAAYMVLNNIAFSVTYLIYIVALTALSWLCAMLGYDKVIQAIAQIK